MAGIHTAKLFAYRQWDCVSDCVGSSFVPGCHSREAVDSRSPGGTGGWWGGGPPGRSERRAMCDGSVPQAKRAQQGVLCELMQLASDGEGQPRSQAHIGVRG